MDENSNVILNDSATDNKETPPAAPVPANGYAGPSIEDMGFIPSLALSKEQKEQQKAKVPEWRPKSVLMGDYVKNHFVQSAMDAQARKTLMTGYENIDTQCPIRPGFHVLGAISSLGKTTFLHQMADQAAKLGSHVIFFELEQDEDALTSKSIARYVNQSAASDPTALRFTADAIFNEPGVIQTPEVMQAVSQYAADVQDRMVVYPSTAELTVEHLINEVNAYMKFTHEKPIVFIDYLQMIAPSKDDNGRIITDIRASIEHIVKELQAFARQNKLAVFLICGLNRENYLTPISFSAFKESSMIEYAADVVWGMQFGVISEPKFEYDISSSKNITGAPKYAKRDVAEKNRMIMAEKAKQKRTIEIVVLKNRNRPVGYSLYFEYEPRYDTFVALDSNRKPFASNTVNIAVNQTDENDDN